LEVNSLIQIISVLIVLAASSIPIHFALKIKTERQRILSSFLFAALIAYSIHTLLESFELVNYQVFTRLCFIVAAFGLMTAIILFVYGIIPTLQPSEFGRVYAAYGGIFIVSAIVWGRIVDKKKPDRYEIIGSMVAVIGAIVIFYAPR